MTSCAESAAGRQQGAGCEPAGDSPPAAPTLLWGWSCVLQAWKLHPVGLGRLLLCLPPPPPHCQHRELCREHAGEPLSRVSPSVGRQSQRTARLAVTAHCGEAGGEALTLTAVVSSFRAAWAQCRPAGQLRLSGVAPSARPSRRQRRCCRPRGQSSCRCSLPAPPSWRWGRGLAQSHRRVSAAHGEPGGLQMELQPPLHLREAARKCGLSPAAVAPLLSTAPGGHDPTEGQP